LGIPAVFHSEIDKLHQHGSTSASRNFGNGLSLRRAHPLRHAGRAVKAPEGMQFEIRADDPALRQFKEMAHRRGRRRQFNEPHRPPHHHVLTVGNAR
jgi:hypothetical protein